MFKRIPNELFGTFSDAVVVEMGEYATIHVSGHVGNDASGKVTAKSFDDEAKLKLVAALESAGVKNFGAWVLLAPGHGDWPASPSMTSWVVSDPTPT